MLRTFVPQLTEPVIALCRSIQSAASPLYVPRPGTAKGLIFLTLEDETGNSNIIVMPDVYEKNRRAVLEPRFIRVSGIVQNQDGIVHLRAEHIAPLVVSAAQVASHDFH